jgi:cytochrome b6-f complex iron-sulfur subunit
MTLSRRQFLAVTAAVVCVGCTDESDDARDAVDAVDLDGDLDGFGGRVGIGTMDEVRETITAGSGAMYVAEARSWVVPTGGDGAGLLALYQKCTHLGCRVPWCATSKRFECPCHGAVFNRVGEYVAGPAPRGLDRFPIEVDADGLVVIDTSDVVEGPADDVLTVDGEPAGAVCIAPPQ